MKLYVVPVDLEAQVKVESEKYKVVTLHLKQVAKG